MSDTAKEKLAPRLPDRLSKFCEPVKRVSQRFKEWR